MDRFRIVSPAPTLTLWTLAACAALLLASAAVASVELGMEGRDPDQIAAGVEAGYARGELPARDAVSFAYMWSADQDFGGGVGAWHPHVMVFAPYDENSMLGGNELGSPLPQVTDDAGMPFTVVVIPVDHSLAVKADIRLRQPAP